MRDRSRLLGPLFVLLLVVSAVAGVGTVVAQESDDEDGLPTADEAYVKEGGDVVLVYHNESRDSQAEFGLDVSKNVFHALVTANGTGSDESELTGRATAILEQNKMMANGSLSAAQPDSVESLSFEADGERTEQNSKGDLSLEATLANTGAAGSASLLRSADASGEMTVGPDSFVANGQFDAQLRTAIGPSERQSFSLTESDGTYVLEAEQNYTISRYSRERWDTRERAKQNIESKYGDLAQALGGSSEVTLSSYSYTETDAGPRLDVEYTIEYAGVEEGLERQLTSTLAESRDYDMTREEAAAVAENVSALEVNEISGQYEQTDDGSVSGEFTADLGNYDGAVRSAMTVAESMETSADVEFDSQIDRIRERFEARQAAELTQTYSLEAHVDSPSSEVTDVSASATYRTQNWADYVQELKDRDLWGGSGSFELTAETRDGEIVASGSATFERENMLRDATDALLNSTDGDALDDDTRKMLQAFRRAELRKARMDVDLRNDQVTFEAGAAFEDLAALRDAARSTTGGLTVASVVGRTEGDQTNTYVTVAGAVDGDADESEVRALGPVGDETEVHLAGDYDRTFPETNVQGAYDYLGLDASSDSDGGDGPLGQPGFGVGVAAAALLGAALLAARRHSP